MAATAALRPKGAREQGAPAFPPPTVTARPIDRAAWIAAFRHVRHETERRAEPLSAEDQQVQSMADASPTKWHRAHVTWFFEQFLLREHLPGYAIFDERLHYLFNSYYVAAGPRQPRIQRGLITRPTMAEVSAYRAHVDQAVVSLLSQVSERALEAVLPILEIGLFHEQQHQELLLTDILHAFAQNPLSPAYDPAWRFPDAAARPGQVSLDRGIAWIGHEGEGFSFDNESPRHETLIAAGRIDRALVTNRQWLAFMEDGGYAKPELWLSDGWYAGPGEGWEAPGYWRRDGDGWATMTLGGLRPVALDAPVTHISYYEADAYARWAGRFLPTEFEWEVAARDGQLPDAFGLVWQWTRSAYLAYPGYRPLPGALGEYNGKFMANQFVLRGSSVATPEGHARLPYRNFFYPHQRWQFTGLRLADAA
ncbi:Hercynine oxygenase [Methylobacterium tardum]|uniref:Ergothioneine biosynthesis protein EgtB n=1 Tax=Methylobacterium tardum TaxID=374432 RepID=A0AA37TIA8_9HYPH|nr:ergothioneine biosynthesis protein EgtB [Methylobacterium tardum]GJE51629.1 Hercynine oxygenase [Methylobacterium tardum]GLS70502.1 ergothioneine biosynthesis protein EgtB [Methylobacterium tardum]